MLVAGESELAPHQSVNVNYLKLPLAHTHISAMVCSQMPRSSSAKVVSDTRCHYCGEVRGVGEVVLTEISGRTRMLLPAGKVLSPAGDLAAALMKNSAMQCRVKTLLCTTSCFTV